MPCNTGQGMSYSLSISDVRREVENQLAKERDLTGAVLLCSACRVLERLGYDFEENPALSIWWDKHKRLDQKRRSTQTGEKERL